MMGVTGSFHSVTADFFLPKQNGTSGPKLWVMCRLRQVNTRAASKSGVRPHGSIHR